MKSVNKWTKSNNIDRKLANFSILFGHIIFNSQMFWYNYELIINNWEVIEMYNNYISSNHIIISLHTLHHITNLRRIIAKPK